jgi:hypothetical protein
MRKMSLRVILFLAVVNIIPLALADYVKFREEVKRIRASPSEDGSMNISLLTPEIIDEKQGEVDCKLSYAEKSGGARYSLLISKNEWSRKNYKNTSYWTPPDYFWLISENGAGKKIKWTHGEWMVKIVLKTPHGPVEYEGNFVYASQSLPPGTSPY